MNQKSLKLSGVPICKYAQKQNTIRRRIKDAWKVNKEINNESMLVGCLIYLLAVLSSTYLLYWGLLGDADDFVIE